MKRVLQPFSELAKIALGMRLRTRVVSVSREDFDQVKTIGRERAPFVISAMHEGGL